MDEDLRRQLYATPPPEFVGARNAAVKRLRAEKRRDEAAAVAALRRPGWDDWALNTVAAEHAGTVGTFADAAGAVRDAQAAAIERREGPDVRSSLRELRDSSAALIRLAGEALGRVGRQPGGGEINARLSEIATNRAAVDALRAGVLGSEGDGADELFSGLQPAARSARRATPAAKATAPAAERSTVEPPPETAADRAAERAERQRRQEALTAARREQRVAARALEKAEAAVEAAADAAERAQRALAEAQRDRDGAAAALAAADAAVTEADADG